MPNITHSSSNAKRDIISLTEQCVKCGMCLPHCPTYKLNNLEGASPRGRIALWQNLAHNKLEFTVKTSEYLNTCLSCGACANNCPAGVNFLELQDLGKSLIRSKIFTNQTPRNINKVINNILVKCLSSKNLTFLLHVSLYIYQNLRLHIIVTRVLFLFPIMKKMIDNLYHMLPRLGRPKFYSNLVSAGCCGQDATNKELRQNHSNQRIEVLLFSGCVNKVANPCAILATLKLLDKLHIKANLSSKLHCCGALYKHNGYLGKAQQLISKNKDNLQTLLETNPNISKILTFDTGCQPEITQQFSQQPGALEVSSIESFILQELKSQERLIKEPDYQQLPAIYIYTPCSQREQTKSDYLTQDLLLSVFPQQKVKTLPTGYGCCGAAGSYMVEQPEQAMKFACKIVEDSLEKYPGINTKQPVIICTSNIGCNLHLTNILRDKYGIDAQIKSPIEIINEYI